MNPRYQAMLHTSPYMAMFGGKLLEIAELPADNDMRMNDGHTHECIYRFEL